jgi:hypothetical protein
MQKWMHFCPTAEITTMKIYIITSFDPFWNSYVVYVSEENSSDCNTKQKQNKQKT